MKISLIVAHDNNKAIGKNGQLPWHLPDDLKWFKKKTVNQIVVMGRTTWEGLQIQPLPRRLNLVMTTKQDYKAEGAVVCHSLNDVFTVASAKEAKELLIAGGGEMYKLFYPLADELILTEVNTEVKDADTFFIDYNQKDWYEIFNEHHKADEKHEFDFTFRILKRIHKA